jgi:hypothetical protein
MPNGVNHLRAACRPSSGFNGWGAFLSVTHEVNKAFRNSKGKARLQSMKFRNTVAFPGNLQIDVSFVVNGPKGLH